MEYILTVRGPGSIVDAHTKEIREMAVNLANPRLFASAGSMHRDSHCPTLCVVGFDQKLSITDLGQQARVVDSIQLQFQDAENGIGSVRWPTCNQSSPSFLEA